MPSLVPFALRVSGAGNSALDGRYLLRRGPPVADDACFLVDGVFWEHELDPRYVIQGVRGGEWYVDEHGVDWFYSSPVAGCDPGAGAWAPNDARDDALPPAPVVQAARADCYYDTVQYETYLWEAQYKICDVDAPLYTQRLSTNRWIAGLCDVSDEASAAACVERYCAAEPPQGSGGCPDENADAVPYSPPPPADDAGGSGGKSSKTGGATVAVVAVPVGLGLVLVAAAACYCYSRRRKPRPVAAKPLEVVHKEEAWRGPAQ